MATVLHRKTKFFKKLGNDSSKRSILFGHNSPKIFAKPPSRGLIPRLDVCEPKYLTLLWSQQVLLGWG
ncbi:MAG: hypothetical protein DRR19_15585 [Candidatus Parabeggiatoa sp. nov. 1]|nr:MAG: hypothetical protein DRR19_15585 [Gammaproteobacteria bacterium]